RVHQLDRDRRLGVGIERAIDRAHAAGADHLVDAILADLRVPEQRGLVLRAALPIGGVLRAADRAVHVPAIVRRGAGSWCAPCVRCARMRLAVVSLMAVASAVGTAAAQTLPPLDKAQVEAIRGACERQEPACDPAALFGSFERTELERVLDRTHLVIDHAPWGKTLRKIIVEPQDVFAPEDAPFDLLDIFHRTT